MQGIGLRAKKKGISVVGLSGSLGEGAMKIFDDGVSSLMTSINAPMTLREAMEHSEELYLNAAIRMFRMIQVGMDIQEKRARQS